MFEPWVIAADVFNYCNCCCYCFLEFSGNLISVSPKLFTHVCLDHTRSSQAPVIFTCKLNESRTDLTQRDALSRQHRGEGVRGQLSPPLARMLWHEPSWLRCSQATLPTTPAPVFTLDHLNLWAVSPTPRHHLHCWDLGGSKVSLSSPPVKRTYFNGSRAKNAGVLLGLG